MVCPYWKWLDLVETTRDVVDDVWRQTEHDPILNHLMLHLLDIIGTSKRNTLVKFWKLALFYFLFFL